VKPFVLFIVTSDPRTSARPVEALRIAVGTAAWKRVDIALYLGGSAAFTLSETTDDIVDAENLTRYRPLLRELARPVYVDADFAPHAGEAAIPVQALNSAGLAQLAAQSTYLLRF
jgi:sulfur relay (sulfurtransferase) DsrF/TusC family protein